MKSISVLLSLLDPFDLMHAKCSEGTQPGSIAFCSADESPPSDPTIDRIIKLVREMRSHSVTQRSGRTRATRALIRKKQEPLSSFSSSSQFGGVVVCSAAVRVRNVEFNESNYNF